MTFPGTDLANSAFGPYDPERAAVLRRYLAEEWAIRSVTTISLDPVDVCEVVLPAIDGMNALAGMDPAKLAALMESIDYMKRGYELWLAPECPPEEVGSPSWLERQERVFTALAELRGEEAPRG